MLDDLLVPYGTTADEQDRAQVERLPSNQEGGNGIKYGEWRVQLRIATCGRGGHAKEQCMSTTPLGAIPIRLLTALSSLSFINYSYRSTVRSSRLFPQLGKKWEKPRIPSLTYF